MRAPMPAHGPFERSSRLALVATCGYIAHMISTGIRELKNNLSHYVRQIEAGKRIAVTAHGRVVAELVPPTKGERVRSASRYDELVAAGIIEPAIKPRALPPKWPDIRLAPGTAGELINSDRGEP
jgi:prevent-host-death family protein